MSAATFSVLALLILFIGDEFTSVESTAEQSNLVETRTDTMQRDRRGFFWECPAGFANLPRLGNMPELYSCYRVIKEKLSYADAERKCRSFHRRAYLVTFNNYGEYEAVVNHLKATYDGSYSSYWIGGVKLHNACSAPWDWYGRIFSSPIREFHWCPQQPDCFKSEEFYIHMQQTSPGNFCWNDNKGSALFDFICEY